MDPTFRYVYSSSLDHRVHVKIGTLEGIVSKPTYEQLLANPLLNFSSVCSDRVPALKALLQVFNNGKPMGLAVNTTHKAFSKRISPSSKCICSWNEWIQLPVQYSELAPTAVLAITIVDVAGSGNQHHIVGGTTLPMFSRNGLYRHGLYDLRVWSKVQADGRLESATPGRPEPSSGDHQMQRLAKLTRKHHMGHIPQVDWLDRLSFREVELVNEREKTESAQMHMSVEFQMVESAGRLYSVVYYEPEGDQHYRFIGKPKLVTVPDSEILQDNLVERKHHRLSRSARSDVLDRELKPNATDRDHLHKIVHVNPPNYQPTSEEADLIWRFRFYLSADKQALVVFLRCINWQTPSEARQALNLLSLWNPLDGSDALQLLSPDFQQPELRQYAVERLQQSSDEELLLYMLQLVQALKYESMDLFERYAERWLPADTADVIQSIDEHMESMSHSSTMSASMRSTQSVLSVGATVATAATTATTTTAVAPAVADVMLGSDTSAGDAIMSDTEIALQLAASEEHFGAPPADTPPNADDLDEAPALVMIADTVGDSGTESISTSPATATSKFDRDTGATAAAVAAPAQPPPALYSFLLGRAGRNAHLANYLYWYLSTECETSVEAVRKTDRHVQRMFVKMLKLLKRLLATGDLAQRQIKQMLDRQQLFVDELVRLVKMVSNESGTKQQKTVRFVELLQDPDQFRIRFTAFEPLQFPLDPSVLITGVRAEKTVLFKSAMMPAMLVFTTTTGKDYPAIFKLGDDLRQDQLVMQIIQLMDRTMRAENLDLKLTPYRVLATGIKHGFLQFVKSMTLNEVCDKHGSIQRYLAMNHGRPEKPLDKALDRYTRSLAGYCVITYLLGVGDRHLDNVLLSEDGEIFHIDFGYILGRDPKPMPPPMKLSKDMVEAMGGVTSEHFRNFAKHIFTAYLYLRRQAKLTLILFALMVDASIPDIALEPDKAVRKVENHLRLDLTEEEAIMHLQRVIESSASAVVPGIMDQMHKIAQYLRR